MCRKSSHASSTRDRHRRATVASERLVAVSTVIAGPGRHRSATATFFFNVMPAANRVGGGAHRLWSWLAAAVRAFMAPERAIRSWRIASTGPVPDLGVTVAAAKTCVRSSRMFSGRGPEHPSPWIWHAGPATSLPSDLTPRLTCTFVVVGTGVDPVTSRFSGGPRPISCRLADLGIRSKAAGQRAFCDRSSLTVRHRDLPPFSAASGTDVARRTPGRTPWGGSSHSCQHVCPAATDPTGRSALWETRGREGAQSLMALSSCAGSPVTVQPAAAGSLRL